MSEPPRRNDDALTLLAVLTDDASRAQVATITGELGDRLLLATTIEEALAHAAREPIDLALVDVGIDGGAGLALVHHIPALRHDARVVAVAHRADLAHGADALAVGADALHLLPLAGDTVASTLAAARSRRLDARERHALAAALAAAHTTRRLYDRAMSALAAGEVSSAAGLFLEGLVAGGLAEGLALYTALGGAAVRVAAIGSLSAAPEEAAALEALARPGGIDGAYAPLRRDGSLVGALLVSGARATSTSILDLATLIATEYAAQRRARAAMTNIDDVGPALTTEEAFLAANEHEIARARRHCRRLTALVLRGCGESSALAVRRELRSSDLVARLGPDELVLLLPETDTLGAATCRRRLERRLRGLARDEGRGALLVTSGAATFPHAGDSLAALLRAARARATAGAPYVALDRAVHALPLGELVPTLARGTLAHFPSVAPLDVPFPGLLALAEQLCVEAQRAGLATYLATDHPGRNLRAPARSLSARDARDAAPTPEAGQRDVRPDRRAASAQGSSVELRGVAHLAGCADLLVIVLRGEHASWAASGRLANDRFVGVHTHDPRLADLLAERLEEGHRRRNPESSP